MGFIDITFSYLFTHRGPLSHFRILTVMSNAAVNTGEQIPFDRLIYLQGTSELSHSRVFMLQGQQINESKLNLTLA